MVVSALGCAYIGGRQSPGPAPTAPAPTASAPSPTAAASRPTNAPETSSAEGFVPAEEAAELIATCGIGGHIAAYFRIPPGNDYRDHFPEMGRSPEIEGVSGLFVVVYEGPVSGPFLGRPGASREPVSDALCVITQDGERMIYGHVSREGMVLPPGAFVASPAASPSATPPPLSVSNGTTLVVTLLINDAEVAAIPPATRLDPIDPAAFPPAPWQVEARTPTGRTLSTLEVRPENIWCTTPAPDGHWGCHGAGARADLSCGRLDIWSGPPMLGPMAPESFPHGDCDP